MRDYATLTQQEWVAIRLLSRYTAGQFDVYALAGSSKASCRADIMSELNGVRTPQAKACITALRARFFDLAGVQPDCYARQTDDFIAWCKAAK
jgi:hypothetical protein